VSERRAVDASGVVAGFADATGRFLPLACTLNCTLAVDRMAGWLGIDREQVAPSGGVVVLPWFDGERTPNLPGASATIVGLRHASEPGAILMATYEGALVGLLEALDRIAELVGASAADAPLTLIGGGAFGPVWQETARRLSGRAIRIPAETEHVALGAAAQAASVLSGEAGSVIARRWAASAVGDRLLDPVPPDLGRIELIRRVRGRAVELSLESGPA
jgi:xylulokinase